MSLLTRLRPHPLDPPTRVLQRLVQQALKTGFVAQYSPASLPALLTLVRDKGLGAHMTHALYARSHPQRLSVVDEHRTWTYAQADRAITGLGESLSERFGVGRRDRVALMMENRGEYIYSWMALFGLGASTVHVSYRFTAQEVAYQLEHSGARVVIGSRYSMPTLQEVAREHPEWELELISVDEDERAHDWHALARRDVREVRRRAPGTSANNIVYTSGTTGKPKGAVRDFSSFGVVELFRVMERMDLSVGERHLVVAPLYHSAAQAFVLMMTALGATIHILKRFDAHEVVRTLSSSDIHSTFMVPTMIHRVLSLPESVFQAYPTPHLRTLVSGAAPFSHALRLRACERFGPTHVYDFYGATELGWVTLVRGDEMMARPGTVGRAIAAQEIGIFTEGARCVPGDVGVIHVRTGQTMEGYLGNQEATDALMTEGWVSVDDLGWLDEDGYLFLGGRARDMVISGGVNLYPAEIEEVLAVCPGVEEVAVMGVPDEAWGERLIAVYVAGDDVGDDVLEAHARTHLSSMKVPRGWWRVDVLPRNPTGKVLKRELRERYSKEFV